MPRGPQAPQNLWHDLYLVASAVAQIAHRAAYVQASEHAAQAAAYKSSPFPKTPKPTTPRPWPTQSVASSSKERIPQAAPAPRSRLEPNLDNVSLPPQAPDGTYTEMKHLQPQRRVENNDHDARPQTDPSSSLKSLDASLNAYFGQPEADDQDSAAAAPATQMTSEKPAHHSSASGLTRKSRVQTSNDASSVSSPATSPSPPPAPSYSSTPSQEEDRDEDLIPEYDATTASSATPMRASRVPSSRIARLMHYGSLGAGLAWGAAGSLLSPGASSQTGQSGPSGAFMSEANIRRLVDKLSRMRGAALKLGQFLSIQDADLLPKEIEDVLRQVQSSANYMPEYQLEKVLKAELGNDWRRRFASFDTKPFAAASIGQVHFGQLATDHPQYPGMHVAVKVQFPGVKQSIESDLSYLKWLLAASALLPRGLFLESTIKQMRMELHDECDYAREAEMGRRFGAIFAQQGDETTRLASTRDPAPLFEVPKVVDELCTANVLTTEMMKGRPLSIVEGLSQKRRNEIATSLMSLCLSELFTHRLMQTDPNFSNFLYSPSSRRIQLIDFGATREYSHEFMDNWLRLLLAAVRGDEADCKRWSLKVGYLLTDDQGHCVESDAMVKAHVASMVLLGQPFRRQQGGELYDFVGHAAITDAIKSHIPVMLRERKTPPPKETYSLNRKLSGTFLLCARLRAKVDCNQVLGQIVEGYEFQDGSRVDTRDWTVSLPHSGQPVPSASAQRSLASGPTGMRGLHTSSRILDQVKDIHEARTDKSSTQPGFVSVADRQGQGRPSRERYGMNLSDRWPRSFQLHDKTSGQGKMDTIAAPPAGTSLSPPVDSPSSSSMTDSDAPAVRTNVEQTPAGKSSERAEDPRSAIESDDELRRVEIQTELQADRNESTATKPALQSQTSPPMIRGLEIPLKPPPPGAEDCCMSGCARCVYDLYKEDLEAYQEDLTDLRAKLTSMKDNPIREDEWDTQLLGAFPSSTTTAAGLESDAGDGGSSAGDKAEEELDQVLKGLDPTMRAFLEMERKMKKQTAAAKAKADAKTTDA